MKPQDKKDVPTSPHKKNPNAYKPQKMKGEPDKDADFDNKGRPNSPF